MGKGRRYESRGATKKEKDNLAFAHVPQIQTNTFPIFE